MCRQAGKRADRPSGKEDKEIKKKTENILGRQVGEFSILCRIYISKKLILKIYCSISKFSKISLVIYFAPRE
jgi:hypothetical protein